MNRMFYKYTTLFSALAATALGIGCGGNGASNNDQGMSVTFLGYFQDYSSASSCTSLPQGLSGAIIPIGMAGPEPATASDSPAGLQADSSFAAILGVQNNLFKQTFRVDRASFDYFIPGAQVQPPSTSVPVSMFLTPASSSGSTGSGGGGTSSGTSTGTSSTGNTGRTPVNGALPPVYNTQCSRGFAQTIVITPAVREWLNFNRESLPEPPFQMEVRTVLSGMSSSGRRYETNPDTLYVSVFTELPAVTPSSGDEDSAGLTDGTVESGGLTSADGSESVGGTDDTSADNSSTDDTGSSESSDL